MNKKFKKTLVAGLAGVMLLGSSAFGAAKVYQKNINATMGRVQFTYNGTNVTNQIETKYGTPGFIDSKEGRSYVPVRAIADIVGANVNWDPNTFTAHITSDTSSTAYLEQQLLYSQAEIQSLRDEIKKLKDGSVSNSGKSVSDVEKDLRKEYDNYEKISFDISLRGKAKDLDLEVELDLGRSRDKEKWDDLRDRDKERFIENMVDDIQKEFKDADIKGYIRDKDSRDKLYTFEKRGSRRIEITKEKSGKGDGSIRDVRKRLDKDYSDDLGNVRSISFDIKDNGRDRYTFYADFDYKKYKKEWNRLDEKDISKFMRRVSELIEDELGSSEIEGYIRDENNDDELAEYNYDRDRVKVY